PQDDQESVALSSAEVAGLAGLRLAARVRQALYHIPSARLAEAHERMRRASIEKRVAYFREGEMDIIRILPCPIAVLPEEVTYLHFVNRTLQGALGRLPELYLADDDVRAALHLYPEEEAWLRACWGPSHRMRNPVFARLDAMIDYPNPMWKETLWFVEPNLNGVGGIYLIPAIEEIVEEEIVPLLLEQDPGLRLRRLADARDLLLQEITAQLVATGRRGRCICFVEPKYEGEGIDEQRSLVEFFRKRDGLETVHADPAELRLEGGEVRYEDHVVDLVYRDYSVLDLVELAAEGVDVEPMRKLFRENRVISSIGAELDQKSCWEVFTDPALADRYFTDEERAVFRRHILWTRLLAERRTQLPGGEDGDLLEYTRREQETLVIKPNRGYGGDGVTIGHTLTRSEWEGAIDAALADEERWVVQRLAGIPVVEFPTLGPDGVLVPEPFYTVMGFAPGPDGVAILARASQRQVVNVAQRGGMCAVMQGTAVNGDQ
ncbi:MAG TPA: hypothetical protein VK132_00545, partial [Gemmatimonadales bacterium]|nr:hypothetical protein [Gemmatimonadales bacterium]